MIQGHERLDRFLEAQATVYRQVLSELSLGAKRGHWMWFIFPQLKGLGRTSTSRFYGIASQAEALAYWQHPVLGARLRESTEFLLAAPAGATAQAIFGTPDDLKLRSSMTLFAAVAPEAGIFRAVLDRFYAGQPDPVTLKLLE